MSILFLCGCSSQTHSSQKETTIPVTLHVEDAKGLPVEGVQVTIVKAPSSDEESRVQRLVRYSVKQTKTEISNGILAEKAITQSR